MKRRFLFLVVPVICMAVQFASACPMCKDSIPNAEGGSGGPTDPSQTSGSLPGGFNTSVYLMLIGLFFTLGLVGWTLVKGMHRQRAGRVSGHIAAKFDRICKPTR